MKSKLNYALTFLNLHKSNFRCPICFSELNLCDKKLLCCNNHSFDISKKGTVMLLNTSNYHQSNIYNSNLFAHRRAFINNNFYNEVYNFISNYINGHFNEYDNLTILDIGCGEALHSMKLLNMIKSKYVYIGFDFSKDAINMASDYNSDDKFFFVGDLTNIPVKDDSVDIILDFLSPYNENELRRLSKKESIIIKISPGKEYLKELRENQEMDDYVNESEVENNIKKNFGKYEKYNLRNTYQITKKDYHNLIAMTPIREKKEKEEINNITIDLNIYIMKGGL